MSGASTAASLRAVTKILLILCVAQIILTPVSGSKRKGKKSVANDVCSRKPNCIPKEKCLNDNKLAKCSEGNICCEDLDKPERGDGKENKHRKSKKNMKVGGGNRSHKKYNKKKKNGIENNEDEKRRPKTRKGKHRKQSKKDKVKAIDEKSENKKGKLRKKDKKAKTGKGKLRKESKKDKDKTKEKFKCSITTPECRALGGTCGKMGFCKTKDKKDKDKDKKDKTKDKKGKNKGKKSKRSTHKIRKEKNKDKDGSKKSICGLFCECCIDKPPPCDNVPSTPACTARGGTCMDRKGCNLGTNIITDECDRRGTECFECCSPKPENHCVNSAVQGIGECKTKCDSHEVEDPQGCTKSGKCCVPVPEPPTCPKKSKCKNGKGKCREQCKKGEEDTGAGCEKHGVANDCKCCKKSTCKPNKKKCKCDDGKPGICRSSGCEPGEKSIPKACKTKSCTCCVKVPLCKPKKKCKKAKGTCKSGGCDSGETIIKKGCKGKGCTCCVNGPPCKPKKKCKKEKGTCKSDGCDPGETIIKKGCKGKGCTCCVGGSPTTPDTTPGPTTPNPAGSTASNTTIVVTNTTVTTTGPTTPSPGSTISNTTIVVTNTTVNATGPTTNGSTTSNTTIVVTNTTVNATGPTTNAIISFDDFMSKFNKTYENKSEAEERIANFKNNVKVMEDHNKLYESGKSSFMMGVNEYSDMTYDEVVSKLMGVNVSGLAHRHKRDTEQWYIPKNVGEEPQFMDHRANGAINPIRNQGHCGSCWAFSVTSSIESNIFLEKGELLQLSEQDLVDCSGPYDNFGCNGGWLSSTMEYVIDNGIAFRDSYPYTAKQGTCNEGAPKTSYKVTGIKRVKQYSDTDLLNALVHMGPISIALYASPNMMHYKSGVLDDDLCTQDTWANHAVVLVGYGTENGKDYWLIRNSWGESWGLNGYIKLARDKENFCWISTHAYIPVIEGSTADGVDATVATPSPTNPSPGPTTTAGPTTLTPGPTTTAGPTTLTPGPTTTGPTTTPGPSGSTPSAISTGSSVSLSSSSPVSHASSSSSSTDSSASPSSSSTDSSASPSSSSTDSSASPSSSSTESSASPSSSSTDSSASSTGSSSSSSSQ